MQSLFRVKFDWNLYFLLLIGIKLIWIDLSWYGFIALGISLHQFMLLFYSIGTALPIRYLAGVLMCVQMLVGPTFAYNGLDQYQHEVYKMKIPEAEYFGYLIPAMLLFIFGLHVTAGKLKGEIINLPEIKKFIDKSGNLPYFFIAIGFLSSIISVYFATSLAFVFYLLSSFKFIGVFMLILGTKQLKTWVLVLVYGSIIASSLAEAMFHDLITWLIMLGAVLAIKYRPSVLVKAGISFGFVILVVVIQQVKGEYRKATWSGSGGNLEAFEDVLSEGRENNSLFNFESLANSNVRINQGFIVTNIMNTVPSKVPFADGEELLQILEAAFMPRVLSPNKLRAGDRILFMKYSGMMIRQGTSMGLSSVGDGYINFGIIGGSIFMFFWGLVLSEVLNGFNKISKFYPVLLLFTPMVFYYPIRPDCELQTSLGHLVKSCMLIGGMFIIWKHNFARVKRRRKQISIETE